MVVYTAELLKVSCGFLREVLAGVVRLMGSFGSVGATSFANFLVQRRGSPEATNEVLEALLAALRIDARLQGFVRLRLARGHLRLLPKVAEAFCRSSQVRKLLR